ncbi:hypothetical protein [Bergeyella sp. RCAD1439]|uniref:hypothetical protein n=1 Tax=Bergeyella anatis TaxID=3113737 RepID=UPI002E174E9A|nr:hypothetical protein [Bergeyella sp. RCAD1439]
MKSNRFFGLVAFFLTSGVWAQSELLGSQKFWSKLEKHCGKAYEGKLTAGGKPGDGFTGKRLVMQVLSCETDRIRIPFYVGEDRSRTWVLTKNKEQQIQLKHDHRHEDGKEDKVTWYGGENPNPGFENLQMFPADGETAQRIPYASTNIWWMTLDDNVFTYNLRRVGSDRVFTVSFDLSVPLEGIEQKPWGWKD